LMDILDKVARKHDFRILLHEKPFEGINGSGKHNNWALATNTGVNLLKPGKNPKSNMRFLTFFVNTLAALYDNADVLRASIASAGNDHRLGANEAPPAIVSAFIGTQLTQVLMDLEKSVKAGKMTPEDKTELKLEIGRIPQVLLDNTDRNRTSPFAFTGNKFEFRAVGSAANCSGPMTVLNTMVSHRLRAFKIDVDARIAKGDKKDEAILKELQRLITRCKPILFEGDGYSNDWVKEAKKRGLNNFRTTPEALAIWKNKDVKKMFESFNVLSSIEIDSRLEVAFENYVLKRQIESKVCGDLAQNHIIPTAITYQNRLITNVQGIQSILSAKEAKAACDTQISLVKEISVHVSKVKTLVDDMKAKRDKIDSVHNAEKQAEAYCSQIKPLMDEIRSHSDALEMLVDDELWPMPKLREILFTR
jgi:glutamine synthetase